MRLFLSSVRGEIETALREIEKPVAVAATAGMRQVAATAVAEGRAEIAAAGMSVRVQKPFTAKVFPSGAKVSTHPTAHVYHKIPWFEIHETGGTIAGKSKLWLALPAVPLGSQGRPLTPRQYVARIGPLVSVNRPGRPPLLFGRAGRATILRATERSTRLRKGALARGVFGESIPLYVGLDSVTLRKKFGLYDVIARAADRLPEFYLANLET